MLGLVSEMYNIIRYTMKGGKPDEFNLSDQSGKKALCKLIGKNKYGAKWRALYYKPATP